MTNHWNYCGMLRVYTSNEQGLMSIIVHSWGLLTEFANSADAVKIGS